MGDQTSSNEQLTEAVVGLLEKAEKLASNKHRAAEMQQSQSGVENFHIASSARLTLLSVVSCVNRPAKL